MSRLAAIFSRRFFWRLFGLLLLACAIGAINLPKLQFNLEIEQFFPEKDKDLEFFLQFKENFEPDDNFLLVAFYKEDGVFDRNFLSEVRDFVIDCRDIPGVTTVQSLPLLRDVKLTPFGPITKPLVSLKSDTDFSKSVANLRGDPMYEGYLFSKDEKSLCAILKTEPDMSYERSDSLMDRAHQLIASSGFDEVHLLGRPYFQQEMVEFEKREILMSGAVSMVLVLIILIWIFRQWMPIVLALWSIGLSALLLLSFILMIGSELNALAAMFPIIMVIVGTSDIVHFYTKFFDEVKAGKSRRDAINLTVRQIGLATLMTSVTTALGFLTLATSNIASIKSFGIDAASGVMIAYAVTLLLSYLFLPLIPKEISMKVGRVSDHLAEPIVKSYFWAKARQSRIIIYSLILLGIVAWGISRVSGDYKLLKTLPRGTDITEDFLFFEEHYGGFRPVEFAVSLQEGKSIWDYDVLHGLDALETEISNTRAMNRPISIVSYVEMAHRIRSGNKNLELPTDSSEYHKSVALAQKIPQVFTESLVSKDETKLRVSSNIVDIGAEQIKELGEGLDRWIEANMDPAIMSVKRTGTSVLIDKNADFIKDNIFQGLGIALALVSFLMFLLFRDWKFLIISLIPNVFPLLFAGALIGFLGIEIEAGISIVFAIIFGIAVDDTIHFLSKYKLETAAGKSREEALQVTFRETGKAILITSIILFFGFLVLLFSNYPPSNTIGMLIAITLFTALVSDLILIPLLLRLLKV